MPDVTVATLEQLRLLPEDDRVELLTRKREDQWFERVSARANARTLADLLVGFANAEGGLVVIGIHGGAVEGVGGAGTRINEWRQAAIDFTVPPVRHRFDFISCTNAAGRLDQLAVLEVEATEHVHTNVRDETFLRVGDENRRLNAFEAMELRYDKGESVHDGTPVDGAGLGSFDSKLVSKYVRLVHARGREEIVLTARGLVHRHGRRAVATVAGILVLGEEPQGLFPQATIRLLRYSGSSRETGPRANVIRDERLEGPLPAQVDRARRLLRRWIPRAVRLGEASRFATDTIIPEYAWVEAIVNAVIHRSYTIGGDHVRVEVFDDRLEVESPGRLPGLVRIDNIRSTRFARNPRIARAMADLGYGRELGEGVNRMFEEMSRAGLPDPVYRQGPASVSVTFLVDPLARRILETLPRGSERFVEYLSRTGRVTTRQAVDFLRVSKPTALGYLHRLVDLELLEHTGTSLKDPRGYWRLRRGPRQRD